MLPVKLLYVYFCLIFYFVFFLLLLSIALIVVITLPTIAIAIVVDQRATTIRGATQKRGYKPMYKSDTKNQAKRLRTITFAFAKLEE